ncbi:PH domain-containing protein [Deinococcus gobiensis]|uniref:Bacterial Pleckstrin homology domain-containing protein n=1 Tax=Deinococcus gobiensis (strain DSM 21396 / JCM 16679 / CGMCC 1.7299 / I-0) TaxID=745776 RepID=H8H2W5_DEIGI|nr:PH domain-containing protein [Deinococcus gobiensis]AFD27862.1 hypothetical protein DGo_PC0070 [Deinococcus gobiensis I-0]
MTGHESVPISTAPEPMPWWWPVARLVLCLGVFALCGLFILPVLLGRPLYKVQGGQITVRGVQAQTIIPAGTPVTQDQIEIRRKVIGSAMVGYTVGQFDLARHGLANLYTDGSDHALVFRTTPRVTVLTPADPEGLLQAWRKNQTGIFRPARPASFSSAVWLSLLLLPLLVFFVRRPQLNYRWVDGALVVNAALSSRRFPVESTRAELTCERLGSRLFGTATPGYYTGTFAMKSAGGGRVQAYATLARPNAALLLKTEGKTYYLTPEDPQAVLDRFRTT